MCAYQLVSVDFDDIILQSLPEIIKSELYLIATALQENHSFVPVIDKTESLNNNIELGLKFSKDVGKFKFFYSSSKEAINWRHIISLSPYIKIIKEYQQICDIYKNALIDDNPARLETIDMARRGLHNQGADLLQESLKHKIKGSFEDFRLVFSVMNLVV